MTRARLMVAGLCAVLVFVLSVSAAGGEDCEGRGCVTEATPKTATTLPGGVSGPAPAGPPGPVTDIQLSDWSTDHYDVGYDEGAWDNWQRKFIGGNMSGLFLASSSVSSVGIATLHAVLSVPWEVVLAPIVDNISRSMADYSEQLNLFRYGLFAAAVFAAIAFCWGRGIGRAFSEVGFSLLAVFFSGLLLSNLGLYYQNVAATLRGVSTLAITATSPDPGTGDPKKALDEFDQSLREAFIERPWLALNWGGPEMVKDCVPAVDQALGEGPNDTDDRPRVLVSTYGTKVDPDQVDTSSATARSVKSALGWAKTAVFGATGGPAAAFIFRDKDGKEVPLDQVKGPCVKASAFNAKPTGDRAGGAALLLVASLCTFALMLRVAFKNVTRSFGLAVGFMLLPIGLAVAAFPGNARDAFFKRAAKTARYGVDMVASFVVIGIVIAIMRGILAVDIAAFASLPVVGTLGPLIFKFWLLIGVALAGNIFMGSALRNAGKAVIRATSATAGAFKANSVPAQLAAAGVGAGVMAAVLAKHNQAGQTVRSAQTLAQTAQSVGSHVSAGAAGAVSAPFKVVAGAGRAAKKAAKGAKSGVAAAGHAAGAAGQPMATVGSVTAAGWQANPAAAKRAPVWGPAVQQMMTRYYVGSGQPGRASSAAAGAATSYAVGKPTAKVVAAGGGPAGAPVGSPQRPYLYVEGREARGHTRVGDAAGGHLFGSAEELSAWQKTTDKRTARLVGDVRRPLTPEDFDPQMDGMKRRWVIERSRHYANELARLRAANQPQAAE